MPEGLSPDKSEEAMQFKAQDDRYVESEESLVTPNTAMAQRQLHEHDMHLDRAAEHVDEHLPEYKQTAADEMEADIGETPNVA